MQLFEVTFLLWFSRVECSQIISIILPVNNFAPQDRLAQQKISQTFPQKIVETFFEKFV